MDKILLGMLLFRRSTIYEIRNYIKCNMKPICSDSTGSIQAGLKKLLDKKYIGYEQITENNKTKKLYYATALGKDEFLNWIDKPVDAFKNRNMDLGKIFFIGMLPIDKRIHLIEQSINNLKEEQNYYNNIKRFSKEEIVFQLNHTTERINNDPLTKDNLKKISNIDDIKKIAADSISYQFLVLDYAISRNKFEIEWYTKFLNDLLEKEGW